MSCVHFHSEVCPLHHFVWSLPGSPTVTTLRPRTVRVDMSLEPQRASPRPEAGAGVEKGSSWGPEAAGLAPEHMGLPWPCHCSPGLGAQFDWGGGVSKTQ